MCEQERRGKCVEVERVEEELVVGGSGESHKSSKLESRKRGGVCVVCVCWTERRLFTRVLGWGSNPPGLHH